MNYTELFRHCVRVEKRDERYTPYRHSEKTLSGFADSGHAGARYGVGCAGITLDFYTDAPEISFRCALLNDMTYGRMERFDFWEDGLFTRSLEWDGFDEIRYRRRKKGVSRVTVYLPILYELVFSEFRLGNWRKADAESERLLILGDSIAQGLRGTYPSMGLSVGLARALGSDWLNLAVGGEYHRSELASEAPDNYKPTRVFVHLGTNDVNMIEPRDRALKRIEDCYRGIAEKWPGVRVDAVTPVWRTEYAHGSDFCKARYTYTLEVRDMMFEECQKFAFRAHDGLLLSPNARDGLADHCHPNDLGFQIYLMNLLESMERTV